MEPLKGKRGLYGQRRSRSAEAARWREIERVLAMTQLERVRLAFELGRRIRAWTHRRSHAAGVLS